MFLTRFFWLFWTCTWAWAWAAPADSPPPAIHRNEAPAASTDAPLSSSLDADMFYGLLLAEFSALDGETSTATNITLEAARRLNDGALFEKAYNLAWQSRSADLLMQVTRSWRQQQPQSREAVRATIQALVVLQRQSETLDLLKTELSLVSPKDKAHAISQIPRYFLRSHDKKQAAQIVEQALAEILNASNAPPAHWSSAWICMAQMKAMSQDGEGAVGALQKAQTQDPGQIAAAQLALELLPHQPAAEAVVKRYLQAAAKPAADIRLGLAKVWVDGQRYGEAIELLKTLTQEQANYAEAWLLLGVLQTQEGPLNAAQAALQRFLSLSNSLAPTPRARGQAQAFLSLSQIAEKRKDYPLAEAWLKRIEDTREFAAVQIRRASVIAKQGRIEEARKILRALPDRSPEENKVKARAELELLKDNKQYLVAYDFAGQAANIHPGDPDWLYEKAMLAERLNRLDEMETLLKQLIRNKPDYFHAYNALGYSLAERNVRLTEAKQWIQKALEYAPDDPYISDSLGWVEFRMGNKTEALRILRAAYKARPDAEIAAHLGEVLWSSGQREQALQIWREGLLSDAENDSLKETLKRLKVSL